MKVDHLRRRAGSGGRSPAIFRASAERDVTIVDSNAESCAPRDDTLGLQGSRVCKLFPTGSTSAGARDRRDEYRCAHSTEVNMVTCQGGRFGLCTKPQESARTMRQPILSDGDSIRTFTARDPTCRSCCDSPEKEVANAALATAVRAGGL